jgi:hypothetical protein
MLIYLSYPMDGQPGHGIPRATKVAAALRKQGLDLVVPHEIMHGGDRHENPAYTHDDYVRADIRLGLSRCGAIALCDGWAHSTGCQMELDWATANDLRVFFVELARVPVWPGRLALVPKLTPMDGKGPL